MKDEDDHYMHEDVDFELLAADEKKRFIRFVDLSTKDETRERQHEDLVILNWRVKKDHHELILHALELRMKATLEEPTSLWHTEMITGLYQAFLLAKESETTFSFTLKCYVIDVMFLTSVIYIVWLDANMINHEIILRHPDKFENDVINRFWKRMVIDIV